MRALVFCVSLLALGGCVPTTAKLSPMGKNPSLPTIQQQTSTQRLLQNLPAAERPVPVAVYNFSDQTGQFRVSKAGQTLSRAVSQGGTSILMRALQDAGRRNWFTVLERENLSNLLNERQIIREMRERYLGETKVNPEALPSLLFAGVILSGGVVGYDTSTLTGGAGAGFLGINARTEYRQDTVTVALRAVSVRTGEVLAQVTTTKSIASYAVGGGAFRYVGFKKLLEAETGMTTNEPDQVALQQAIEKAVYALIMEGAEQQLWAFADAKRGTELLASYRDEREGKVTAEEIRDATLKAERRQKKQKKQQKQGKQEPARKVETQPSADASPGSPKIAVVQQLPLRSLQQAVAAAELSSSAPRNPAAGTTDPTVRSGN